ncbi:MAG: SurA N-terminal domain-containing protein [Rhodobacteraceae bacterium]|nr:SurA N-terminal domain-containing protein [Paracoccaceae bacterium]
MAESVGKKARGIGVWVIMGLLFFGLIGFSAGSFGGGRQTIGTVGEKRISAQTYFSELQNTIRGFEQRTGANISFPEAQSLGLQQQALQSVVSQRALDNEAAQLGLSVGNAQVAEQIRATGFTGLDGQFDRVLYADTLRRNGLTEGMYETQIRDDLSRQLLQIAVVSGISTPQTYTDTLLAFAGEERGFTWALMDERDLITGVPLPTDEDLQSEYEANPDAYTLPETKRITYAWVTPSMILDTIKVDEEQLRAVYDKRGSEFSQPERRIVERLIFGTEEAADEALARINEGSSFEGEVERRGLVLTDVDMGDVLKEDLGDAGDAVFGVDDLIVVKAPTSLGPALFRINAILPANEVTFEEAAEGLRSELALDRAARAIADQIDFLENELAGGATLEDLAAISDMEIGQIDWFPGVDEGPAAYAAFQDAASVVSESDFPEIGELDDGGLFAVRLDEIVEPRLQPLDAVRDQVARAWELNAISADLTALAERLAPQIAAGTDMATLGLTASVEEQITRAAFVPGAPDGFLDIVFGMEPGDVEVIQGTGQVAMVRLNSVDAADPSDPNTAELIAAFETQIAQSYAQDLYGAYAQGILDNTTISLDQQQINGIHAQMQ